MSGPDRVTAAEIKIALRRLYAQPEWALLFEVGDATGARHTRFADAIAMSLWPSRGLTLTGIEIKVSRSDWMKERAQPQKAETIAAFCDYWTLVTGPKVVLDLTEIPPAWGFMEFNGGRFTTRKIAEKTDAAPISRAFLAALLRRADKADDDMIAAEVKRHTAFQDEAFQMRVDAAAARRSDEATRIADQVKEFEEASGIKLSEWSRWGGDAKEVGRAAKAIVASGIDSYSGLFQIARDLRGMSDKIEKAMIDHGLAEDKSNLPALGRFVKRGK